MADEVISLGKSKEEVAFALLKEVAHVEGRIFAKNGHSGLQPADRKYILDTYVECLKATRGARPGTQAPY